MAKAALKTTAPALNQPKGKASWLFANTTLTFDQIADFCNLHPLEVEAIANGDPGSNIPPENPVEAGDLTHEEIARCEADESARLKLSRREGPQAASRAKGPRYTPVSKRADKPDAVAWLLRYHPELSDGIIAKLIGSTKTTVASIRNRAHPNMTNLKPRDPVLLGLCRQEELNAILQKHGKKPVAAEEAGEGNSFAVGPEDDQPDVREWI